MPIYLIIIFIAFGALFAVFVALTALAFYAQNKAFGGRFDKNKDLRYFSAEDFSLSAVPVKTYDKKTLLRGYLYSRADVSSAGALVIFSHGMGPGHCAYTTEIAYFCDHGFAVLVFDCAGCGLSDGGSMRGMEASTCALIAAVKFARSDNRLKNFKIYIVGHSMGAYSALCAAPYAMPDGIVAFSAPERPSYMVRHGAAPVIGKTLAKILRPFVCMAAHLFFGKYADLSASRQVALSGVPALIFHGDEDEMVPLACSAYSASDSPNVKTVLCRGKGHNPYSTFAAEKLLRELAAAVGRANEMDRDEKEKFFSSIDYAAVCEEDETVMGEALSFISAD